ncbi:family 10 glycosylhydrolase [candidate division KSB1 bacterium]|nr:family 10 glycosylhydrolase [candidate division KSB1 bacterium]
MKKYVSIILLIAGFVFAGNNEEFRATWVITWDHISGSASVAANQAHVRKIMDQHQGANMNALLWQARQGGTAYYRSSFEPWGSYAGSKDPGYDHLAYAVQEAHNRGMELHAWFNVFQTSSIAGGTPADEHPEWICRNSSGDAMQSYICVSPGLEAVRAYTIQVAMEIVRNYDIDGLHLDYVRWNEYSGAALAKESESEAAPRLLDGMITPEQLQDLQANQASRYLYDVEHPYSAGVPTGFASWEEWWRWSVTEFVKTLHDSIQACKPWVRLSAAALGNYNWGGWQGYGTVYQDAALWFNAGYVDQLTPMHYHWFSYYGFRDMLIGVSGDNTSSTCWGKYIQPGIDAGRLYSCGPSATDLGSNPRWMDPKPMVQAGRDVSWVDGHQFFSYGDWDTYRYFDLAQAELYPRKSKIRAAKFLLDDTPLAPTLEVTKIDSFHYQIVVAPDVGFTTSGRFAIYRSQNATAEPDADEIIDIHFGNDAYTYLETFDGLQNHMGKYYYFATCFDRYWNESAVSNVDSSDVIISVAPTIISTYPAEGDTVAVNVKGAIQFSKSMDIASVTEAFSATPDITVKTYKWSDDNKAVEIELMQPLNYATAYTVTMSATAKDINGTALDGNGDGMAGDDFTFSFYTQEKDIFGPKIVASHPQESVAPPFMVEDIIGLVFDELIDPATVADSTYKLMKGDTLIEAVHMLYNGGVQSVLSIQPKQPLDINSDYQLWLGGTVKDTSGNIIAEPFTLPFATASTRNAQVEYIERFYGTTYWKDPEYSGSTTGTIGPNTTFTKSRDNWMPNVIPQQRTSAALQYEWDESASSFLLREYFDFAASYPKVRFDSTYTLQCYVFGDGSNNQIRFCLDDGSQHEVSQWWVIDWLGWRLLEWKLSDPAAAGSWAGLGDGVFNSSSLNFDSIQLTHTPGAATTGTLFFDDIQVVKKSPYPVKVEEEETIRPQHFVLYQNYPNPFNPRTTIAFDLPAPGPVKLTLYDLLGREVMVLLDEPKTAGHHRVDLDASRLSSGVYFYRLHYADQDRIKRLMVIK